MIQSTPAIYSPRLPANRLTLTGRTVALAVSGGCLCTLCVASKLMPSPDGLGTHQQLQLLACPFYARTGIPCPTCGMTTAFAWFVRGNFLASFYVQPMGMVVALLSTIAVWWGLYEALTGRAPHRMLRELPAGTYYALILFAIAAWGWKIFIHLHGIDGWKS